MMKIGDGERPILRGVSFRQGEHWVAVCLDRYMVTFANTEEELWGRIYRMFLIHIDASLVEGRKPFDGLPEAPPKYWRIWESLASQPEKRESPPSELVGSVFPELMIRRSQAEIAAPC